MKHFSTGMLAAFFAACLGLTTIAATSGTALAQGKVRPSAHAAVSKGKLVAQASPAASSTMPPAPSVEPASGGAPPPLPGTPAPAAPSSAAPAAASGGSAPAAVPASDFGSPPSGEVPILFNDRHVYSKPDRLHNARVLAALVRNGSVLVPLRSMFEQMGATVNYDPGTKTVDVMKPGSDVKVALGKPEVIVNGESRPLDVPPEMYKGVLLVPLRVLSEGMGAYVQWVPDKHTVVVRYLAAAPPSPPPSEAPVATAPPEASPAPTSPPAPRAKSKYEHFVVGDFVFAPKVYNAISPGNGSSSFAGRLAVEFPLFNIPWMLEGNYRSFRYPHPTNHDPTRTCPSFDQSCVNAIGMQGEVYVPTFQARNDDFDGRFGLKVADPRIYIGIGYLFRNTNFEGGAFSTQQHGLGFGVEKLPDLDQPFSLYGSVYYYPFVTTNGRQFLGTGLGFGAVQFRTLTYQIGGDFVFGNSPLFLDFGYQGERANVKQNSPIDENYSGPYVGLGIHF